MIVAAGEALVDLLVAGEDVVAAPGGAPYNVARGCARLGMPTALLASVSDDGFGARLADGLAASGVSDVLLQRTQRPTTLAVAELDASGAATYRFYTEGTSSPALSPQTLPGGVAVFVTGGLGLVLEPMATAIESVVLGADRGVLVVVDLNCRPKAIDDRDAYVARLGRVLGRVDVLKVSDDDLAWLRGPDTPPLAGAGELLGAGPQVVLVTSGGRDTAIVTRTGTTTVPVGVVPVVDTIGAGDAFTAGFASWWLAMGRGRAEFGDAAALEAAVTAAHVVAAVVVGRRGADPPWRAELAPDWV